MSLPNDRWAAFLHELDGLEAAERHGDFLGAIHRGKALESSLDPDWDDAYFIQLKQLLWRVHKKRPGMDHIEIQLREKELADHGQLEGASQLSKDASVTH